MPEIVKRKTFSRINRFQRPIINIVIVTSFVAIILELCIAYLYFDNTVINPLKEMSPLKILVLIILIEVPLIFYLVIVWAYKVSSHLVGAFERVLAELDNVLAGKGKKHIHARKGDDLAEELLKRINTLIDRIP